MVMVALRLYPLTTPSIPFTIEKVIPIQTGSSGLTSFREIPGIYLFVLNTTIRPPLLLFLNEHVNDFKKKIRSFSSLKGKSVFVRFVQKVLWHGQ
jgi:hypothetical protein